jgi:hypothetical protein
MNKFVYIKVIVYYKDFLIKENKVLICVLQNNCNVIHNDTKKGARLLLCYLKIKLK